MVEGIEGFIFIEFILLDHLLSVFHQIVGIEPFLGSHFLHVVNDRGLDIIQMFQFLGYVWPGFI